MIQPRFFYTGKIPCHKEQRNRNISRVCLVKPSCLLKIQKAYLSSGDRTKLILSQFKSHCEGPYNVGIFLFEQIEMGKSGCSVKLANSIAALRVAFRVQSAPSYQMEF